MLFFDEANGEIETAGNSAEVWFIVDEADTSDVPETVYVEVDGTTFVWDAVGDDWDLAH